MTREEFMDIVYSELHSDGDNNRANRIIDAADDYAEEQTRWIPVSERLPEEAGMYLCSYDDDDVGTSFFDISMNEFNMLHEQVTAWMYIPEPYQPEIPTGAEGSDKYGTI